jgi:hypothetical protein
MTPEAIRITIAESLGWLSPAKKLFASIPNWPEDLNAVHELEKTLTEDEQFKFRILLSKNSDGRKAVFLTVEAATCHATALQRCEAYLRVKGLWMDEL